MSLSTSMFNINILCTLIVLLLCVDLSQSAESPKQQHYDEQKLSDIPYEVLNAFTVKGEGGNGAGVVIENDISPKLEDALKAFKGLNGGAWRGALAAKIGLSETVFVSLPQSKEGLITMRYFTPITEVPNCGHATIAAVAHLKAKNRIPAGAARVTIQTTKEKEILLVALNKNGTVSLTQKKPDFSRGQEVNISSVEKSLGLTADQIMLEPRPTIVSTGLFDVLVRVKNAKVLQELEPDFPFMKTLSQKLGVTGFHVYAILTDEEKQTFGADIYARNFAPYVGINEESATGTSNGALCSLLWKYKVLPKNVKTVVIAQGDYMKQPQPSRIEVNILSGEPGDDAPSVGGYVNSKKMRLGGK